MRFSIVVIIVVVVVGILVACARKDSAKFSVDEAAAIKEMQKQLSYLTDRQQIHDVYLRYMRGVDRTDVALLKTAFWPDAQINYGPNSYSVDDFALKHVRQHQSWLAGWGHLITNETVEINSDVAHVETYFTALFRPKDDRAFPSGETIIGGRYIDRLDRRNGEWRIAVREAIPQFWTKDVAGAYATFGKKATAGSDCAMGTWDLRDPSYVRPLVKRGADMVGAPCAD